MIKIEEKLSKQSIARLDIEDKSINLLKDGKIKNLGQLCDRSRVDLKKLKLDENMIEIIESELQLIGLNLKNS